MSIILLPFNEGRKKKKNNKSKGKSAAENNREIIDSGFIEPVKEISDLVTPRSTIVSSLIQRQIIDTNPSSFEIDSIYAELGRVEGSIAFFRKQTQKYSLEHIREFYSGNNALGLILLQKEITFRPVHLLSEFNYTPLNKDLSNTASESQTIRDDARSHTGTARTWLRNYAAGVFKDWNARWAIIENILEAENQHSDFITVSDTADDDTSAGMVTTFPKHATNAEFQQYLDSKFKPVISQDVGAEILSLALTLHLADTYVKSCYNLSPISDFAYLDIARFNDNDRFKKDFDTTTRFSEDLVGKNYFNRIDVSHARNTRLTARSGPTFGKDFRAEHFEIRYHSRYDTRERVIKKHLSASRYPSDLESNRAQIQLIRDINLYVDNLEFRGNPDNYDDNERQAEKINYIPGPRYDIFNYQKLDTTESVYTRGPTIYKTDNLSAFLKAFFIRKVLMKSMFLNNTGPLLHSKHSLNDEGSENAIFPTSFEEDVEAFKANNTDDISNFFYNPIKVGEKIIILGDSLNKDYYNSLGLHFNSIVDEIEIKKILLRNKFLGDSEVDLKQRFLPSADQSKLAQYVFKKLFSFKTSNSDNGTLINHEDKSVTNYSLERCRANILTDPRNIVAHLTRGRMIKYIWKSAIAAAVHSPPNKSNENLDRNTHALNYSIKFFNISSRAPRTLSGLSVDASTYYANSMGFKNPRDMSVISLEDNVDLNSQLNSARQDSYDEELPGIVGDGALNDGHVFGSSLAGDAAHGFSGDGKLREDFEFAINNALVHTISSEQDKSALIFLFLLMQLSERIEGALLGAIAMENPVFMAGDKPQYKNIAYSLAQEFISKCEDTSSNWYKYNSGSGSISESIKGFLKKVISANRNTGEFSAEGEGYNNLITNIRNYVINSETSPFKSDQVFQDIYEKHEFISDLPNNLNRKLRKYRMYLHQVGTLVSRNRHGMGMSVNDIQSIGGFLDINAGENSYRNVALDFLSRGNYSAQFEGAGDGSPMESYLGSSSLQSPTVNLEEFRRSTAANSNLQQTRGIHKSGIRGAGAGGSRSNSTFANVKQSYLRSSEFKEKLLRPLKEEAFKTGETNPFVLISENICAQLFYGYNDHHVMRNFEDNNELGYYHSFQDNPSGILKSLGLLEDKNLQMDIEEIFSVIWNYVKIGVDLVSSLPNFQLNFKFTHYPDETNDMAVEQGYQETLGRAIGHYQSFTPRNIGAGRATSLGGLYSKVGNAEAQLLNRINTAVNFNEDFRSRNNTIIDNVDDRERANFRDFVASRRHEAESLIGNLYDYMEVANAYFYVAESLNVIEPEFRLEIRCIDDLSDSNYSRDPMQYFRNALKIGCLPHLTVANKENLTNLKLLLRRTPENSNVESHAERALNNHLKYFGSFKNTKKFLGGGKKIISAIQYGHKRPPLHHYYTDHLNSGANESSLPIFTFVPADTQVAEAEALTRSTGFQVLPRSICGFVPVYKGERVTQLKHNWSLLIDAWNQDGRTLIDEIGALSDDVKIANFGVANQKQASADISSIDIINVNNNAAARDATYFSEDFVNDRENIDAVVEEYSAEMKTFGPAWVYSQLTSRVASIAHHIGRQANALNVGSSYIHQEHNYEIKNVKQPVSAKRNYIEFTTQVSKVDYNFIEAISVLSQQGQSSYGGYHTVDRRTLKSRADWAKRQNRVNKGKQYSADLPPVRKLSMEPGQRLRDLAKFALIMLADDSNSYEGTDFQGFSDLYNRIYYSWGHDQSDPKNFELQILRFLYSFLKFYDDEKTLESVKIPVYFPNYKRFKYGPQGSSISEYLRSGHGGFGGGIRKVDHLTWPDIYSSIPSSYYQGPGQKPNHEQMYLMGETEAAGHSAEIRVTPVFDVGLEKAKTHVQYPFLAAFRTNSSARHMNPMFTTVAQVAEKVRLMFFGTGNLIGLGRLLKLGVYANIANQTDQPGYFGTLPKNDLDAPATRADTSNTRMVKFQGTSFTKDQPRMIIPRSHAERWSDIYVPMQMQSLGAPKSLYNKAGSNHRPQDPDQPEDEKVVQYGCPVGAPWILNPGYKGYKHYNVLMGRLQGLNPSSTNNTWFHYNTLENGVEYHYSHFTSRYVPFSMGRATFCSLGETPTRELYIDEFNNINYQSHIQDFNLLGDLNGTTNAYALSYYDTTFKANQVENNVNSDEAILRWEQANMLPTEAQAAGDSQERRVTWTLKDASNSFFYHYLVEPTHRNTGSGDFLYPRQFRGGVFQDPRTVGANPIYASSYHSDSRSVRVRMYVYSRDIYSERTYPEFRMVVNPLYGSQYFSGFTDPLPTPLWVPQTWAATRAANQNQEDPYGTYEHWSLGRYFYTDLGAVTENGEEDRHGDRRMGIVAPWETRYEDIKTTSPVIDIFPYKPFVIDYGPTMNDFSPNLSWIQGVPAKHGEGTADPAQIHNCHPKLTRFDPNIRIQHFNLPNSTWILQDRQTFGDISVMYINLETPENPELGFLALRYDEENCKIIVQWFPRRTLYKRLPTARFGDRGLSPYNFYTKEIANFEGANYEFEPTTFYLFLPGYDYYFEHGSNPDGVKSNTDPLDTTEVYMFNGRKTSADKGSLYSLFTKFRLCLNTFGQDYRVYFEDNFTRSNSSIEEYELVNRKKAQSDATSAYQSRIYLARGDSNTSLPFSSFSLEPITSKSQGRFNIERDLFGIGAIPDLDLHIPLKKNASGATFNYDFGEDDDFLYESKFNNNPRATTENDFLLTKLGNADTARINLGNTFKNFFLNYKYFPEFNTSIDAQDILSPFRFTQSRTGTYARRRLVGVYEPQDILGITKARFHNDLLSYRKEIKEEILPAAREFIEKLHGHLRQTILDMQYYDRQEPNQEEQQILGQMNLWPKRGTHTNNPDAVKHWTRTLNFAMFASNYFVYLYPHSLSLPQAQVFASKQQETVTLPGAALVDFNWKQIHKQSQKINNSLNKNLSNKGLKQVDSLFELEADYTNYLVSLYKTSKFKEEAYNLAMDHYESTLENLDLEQNYDGPPLHETLEHNQVGQKITKFLENIGTFALTPEVVGNIESVYLLSNIHSMTGLDEQMGFVGEKQPHGAGDLPPQTDQAGHFKIDILNDDGISPHHYRAPFKLSPYAVKTGRVENLSKDSHLSTWKAVEERFYNGGPDEVDGTTNCKIEGENTRVCVVGIESGALHQIVNYDRISLEEAIEDTQSGRRKNTLNSSYFEIELILKDPMRPYLNFERIGGNNVYGRQNYFYLHNPNHEDSDIEDGNPQLVEQNFMWWQYSPLSQILANAEEADKFESIIDRKDYLESHDHYNYIQTFTFNRVDLGEHQTRKTINSPEILDLYLKKYASNVLGLDYFSFMIPIGTNHNLLDSMAARTEELKGFDEVSYQEVVNPYLKYMFEHIGDKDGADESIFNTIKYFINRRDLRGIYQADEITHFDSIGRKLIKPTPTSNFSIFNYNLIREVGEGEMLLKPFEFSAPVTRESLRAAETMVNINSYDPDAFRKVSAGFAFDKVIAIPYRLNQFKLSNFIDMNYWEEFAEDYPDIWAYNGGGILDEDLSQIGNNLSYLDNTTPHGSGIYVIKNKSSQPLTLQVRIKPTKRYASRTIR